MAHKSVRLGSKIVFNFPLEVTFRSTNPCGCLYIQIFLFDKNSSGII
jgi:hypothetical protein